MQRHASHSWQLFAKTTILIVVFASLLIFVVIALWKGPDIPRDVPSESRRVSNRDFSIVCPAGWSEGERITGSIALYPDSWVFERYGAAILANQISTRPEDLPGFQETVFQGTPAFEKLQIDESSGIGRSPHFQYWIAFERGSDSYCLHYSAWQPLNTVPPEVMAYLETFKCREPDQE